MCGDQRSSLPWWRSKSYLFEFGDTTSLHTHPTPPPTPTNQSMAEDITAAGEQAADDDITNIFSDIHKTITNDPSKTPIPGGAVHPLTRHVIDFLQHICHHNDTLHRLSDNTDLINNFEPESPSAEYLPADENIRPFAAQVVSVMDLLDATLEEKAKLYKDPSLQYIFLMNNSQYIFQQVKTSAGLRLTLGDPWFRRRSSAVRQHHKSYQRETCNRVLHCLSQDGLFSAGNKINKSVAKERLKLFTAVMEEIHRTQRVWVVFDDQLQSELRISISAVIVPAYRSFVSRIRQHLSEKKVNKYVKHQPEDVERMMEELFEGKPASGSGRTRSGLESSYSARLDEQFSKILRSSRESLSRVSSSLNPRVSTKLE